MGSFLEAAERNQNKPPIGIRFIECIKKKRLSYRTHQAIVLIVTFLAYTSYHAARKTTSIVKSTLDPESSEAGLKFVPWRITYSSEPGEIKSLSWKLGDGWAPFNASDGTALLGELDLAFLAIYALGMYCSGHLGDRINLRIFLTVGMVGTGIFTSLFGVGFWANVHNFYYYLMMQMLAGLFQSTGWPSVVAVVGNWFGKKKRGLIMGIWNAHTSVGNISGSLIAAAMLSYGWGWSFVLPGLLITVFLASLCLHYCLLVPRLLELTKMKMNWILQVKLGRELLSLFWHRSLVLNRKLWDSLKHGKYLELLHSLSAYFLPNWWPTPSSTGFLSTLATQPLTGKYLSDGTAGNLSTLFDVGGVVGGILAGHISDRLDARAITAASFMYCSIPALFFYRSYGHLSLGVNIAFMLLTGMLVNGPYALITTAVSADLGTHSSLKGNSRALATVTAIIDGTGSVGAAIGPLLTGYISAKSWSAVFTMLMAAALVAGLLLTRLVVAEVAAKIAESRSQGSPASKAQAAAFDV
ncbi:MAJOR FACILITATOR SUPERFAMILY TRANSPORTER 16 ISOFORM B [Salix viminalis]|uniref:MAJOR FACILITATOR SUPERFAMILY TRANSPORTER 16 ISOFORM B n=1 Tax=Salix viminalis TaxID=40686 RepID=A0A9Q0YYI8_SALVM|nr:MAJOR FACILITATOR SUPERFAMILY TRANSPORTER 16 ISOFORM B [Salix viminalis]